MARLIDADALIDFLDVGHLRHPSELCFSEIDVANLLLHAPTISPDDVRGVGCAYCKEDRDGYTMPLEKNAHAWVQYPNKLVIQFGKEIRKCEIKYCPMCGARMKGVSEDANN